MPTGRRARSRRTVRPRRARPVPPVQPEPPRPAIVNLAEDPRGHIVCRSCGRIHGLELAELDRHLLTEFAARAPDGWSVEHVAYSLAGLCRRCREGPRAP